MMLPTTADDEMILEDSFSRQEEASMYGSAVPSIPGDREEA